MLNNFKHISIFLFFALLSLSAASFSVANSLVVVYPHNNSTINANSTFFVGHINPKATLTINNIPVKVYANGSFVKVINLNEGINKVVFKSALRNTVSTKVLTLKAQTDMTVNKKPSSVFVDKPEVLTIIKDEVPLRKSPYGDRLTPAKSGMIFESQGYINNHYKVKLDDNNFAYIDKNFAKVVNINKLEKQLLKKVEITENYNCILIKIPMEQPVPLEVQNDKNTIKLRLYGTELNFENYILKSPYVEQFVFNNDETDIKILANNINGYDYYYENNVLIFSIKKPFKSGLYGKVIAVDPGHGGKEYGAIGPTEIPEKDVNLKIAMFLKEYLENRGATVIMTRIDDSYVDLYERVDIAKKNNADALISIHNNSLPDGQNPYEVHGTTTYYYQPQAEILAQSIHKNLLNATRFNDSGVKTASFVLTRPTTPVSVLLEIGFMINPFEYAKLISEKEQKKYASAISDGIYEYFDR